MRIGLFGGTFDPPHVGHLMIAQIASEVAYLDRVDFIPAAIPPHKQQQVITDMALRLDMVTISLRSFSTFFVSTMEYERNGPSYTVDTVRAYRKRYPKDDLFLLLGADMYDNFPLWKDADQILQEVTLIVAPRPIQERVVESQPVGPALHMKVIDLDMPALEISSSWLRERLLAGLRVDPLLPEGVAKWIVERGVYDRS